MKQSKKLIAAVLCLAMLLTYIPGSLFAIKASAAENALSAGVSIVEGYDDYVGADWASKLDLPENITWEDPAKYVDPDTPGLYVVPGKDADGKEVSFVVKVRAYENLFPSNADFEATATASWGAPWFPGWNISEKYFDKMNVTPVANGMYGQGAMYVPIPNEKNADNGTVVNSNSLHNAINATGAGQYLISIDAWSDAEYADINVWPQLVLDYGSTTNRVYLEGTKVPFAATSQTATGIVDIDLTHNDVALSKAVFYIKKNMTQIPYVCVDNAALVLLKQAFEVPANLLTVTSVDGDLAPISLVQNYDDLAGKDWISYALPTTVNATLSDGSAVAVPLKWDVAPMGDMSKTGKYILTGKVATTDYIANGLAVKQFVNIHEYQNLIPSNGDFENSAIASYGAPWFPGWEVPGNVFDQMQATPVDNGIYGQAAKFVCIADKLYQQVAKHKESSKLLANIQSAGAGQYLVAVDAWADAEYAKLKFYPRLALNYGSTTVNLDGVQIPFAATSQTSSAVVNIDMEKDGVALSGATFSIMKYSTAVGYVCVDNAMVVLMKQAYTGEIPADITAINTEISTVYSIAQNYDDLVGESWKTALGLAETVNVTLSTGETVDVAVEWDYAPLGDLSKVGAYTLIGKPSAAVYSNSEGLYVEQTIIIAESANLIPSNGDFETSATASYGAPWFPGWTVSATTYDRMQATAVDNGIYGQAAKFVCIAGKTNAVIATHSQKDALLANIQAAGAGQYMVTVDAWADAEYSNIKFYPRLALNYGSETVNIDGVQLPFTASSQASSAIVDIAMEKGGVALSGATFSIMKYMTNVGYVCVDNAAVVLLKSELPLLEECEHTPAEAVKENEVAADCTNAGSYELVVYCTKCDEELSRETVTVDATGHAWGEGVIDPDATCTEDGVKTYTCGTCGETKTEAVSAKGHTPAEAVKENDVAADCTNTGSYDLVVYCSVCGAEINRETVTVDALGHDYDAVVTAPTCTTEGYTTYTCACGDSYVADKVAATGHAWGEGVIDPDATCTEDGVKTYTCGTCGETKTEAVSAKGHTPGEAVKENDVAADCTNTGSYDLVVYCSVCGAEISRETVTVDALGHDYDAVVTAPTCTDKGYTTYTCSVCGDTYIADEVEATGHQYGGLQVHSATCTEDGYIVISCNKGCGCSWDSRYDQEAKDYLAQFPFINVTAKGHTDGEAVIENNIAPDCTNTGSYDTVTYCTVCGAETSRVTTTVDALGHSYNAVVTAPTCTDKGYTTYTCSVCGDSYIGDEVAALGHTAGTAVKENWVSPSNTSDGSYDRVVYCTVCGAEISRESVVTKLPNATVTVKDPTVLTPEDDYMCWPSGDATVNRPLQIVMNFKANDTLEECLAGEFSKYLVDFYLTIDGLTNGSIISDGCYLAGNYGTFGWIVIPADGLELENGVSYPIVSGYDATLNYKDICKSVKDFTAAIYITD
ncbi:MAG: hypothetical protein E7447_01830, partial [Ruminococcaceae bacterium]|nr:hypothetical protein [Oscillospiraceae bacterium]